MPDTKSNAKRTEPVPPQDLSEAQFTTLGLEQLQTPIWIYDTQNFRIHWANTKGLKLWEAKSLQELSGRNFRSEMSDAIYTTLSAYLDDFTAGHTINRWWQLSPKGHSKNVFCRFSGIRLNDGHMAMLCEGIEEDWQYRILTELGIHLMQGYLFARPMPAGDLQRLLEAQTYRSPGGER